MLSEMDMEEHVVGSCNNDATGHVIKGKRTKRRLRPLSPCAVAVAATVTSSCSSASGGGDGGSFSSTTFEGTDQEEEEDMANCLILLAQGGDPNRHRDHAENHVVDGGNARNNINKIMTEEIRATIKSSTTGSGFYIYECKTCNRTFPSFQALGGHRASHKKPKLMMTTQTQQQEGKTKSPPTATAAAAAAPPLIEFEETTKQISPPLVSLELMGCGGVNSNFHGNNNKSTKPNSKIHECSICGSEFTSGQALGGHMRRHRASNNNNTAPPQTSTTFVDAAVKSRNVLELDLNLPAPPEDDLRDSKFQFPALVGCHY